MKTFSQMIIDALRVNLKDKDASKCAVKPRVDIPATIAQLLVEDLPCAAHRFAVKRGIVKRRFTWVRSATP